MKKTLTIIIFLVASLNLLAQCSVSITAISCCTNNNGYNCDGAATANPIGQSPFTYSWTTIPVQTTQTATGLCPINYIVTVTDANACTSTDTVTVYPVILTTIISTPASCSSCYDGTASVLANGGSPPYTYSWWPSGDTTQNLTNMITGRWGVCVYDLNGCVSCATTTIGVTTSIENINRSMILKIFPNPSNGSITVDFDKAINIKVIRLIDLLGNIIQQWTVNQTKLQIDNLQSGTYILAVIDKDNRVAIRKIISCP